MAVAVVVDVFAVVGVDCGLVGVGVQSVSVETVLRPTSDEMLPSMSRYST